jgi:hypothetical protein
MKFLECEQLTRREHWLAQDCCFGSGSLACGHLAYAHALSRCAARSLNSELTDGLDLGGCLVRGTLTAWSCAPPLRLCARPL